ncbi:MAG: ATP-binding protein [Bacteroidales bacterium]|nr:ATP-binding protein [Bacteroidales bacterium]
MKYVKRQISDAILEAYKYYSVITITGPRQVGKTTLCKNLFPEYEYINLERAAQRNVIEQDIEAFFSANKKNLIIDEIHHLPELLSYIQVIVDEHPERKFVLTGSSNFKLLHNISQSLAGRTSLFTLLPFSLKEVSDITSISTNELLFNGLYPDIFAKKTPASLLYRNYYNTYIERDVHQLINIKNMMAFQTFIRLCAGRVGSECNFSSLANEVGVSSPTINEWISILQSSYILWKLPPYYANINKRLVKSPKLYFYDTGLLCYLLGIEKAEQLQTHPLKGNIFENFVVSEYLKKRFNEGKDSNLFYYRENKGNEVDLLSVNGDKMNICEIKSAQTYSTTFTKGLKHIEALFGDKIEKSFVVYDGAIESDSDLHGIYNFRNMPEF